MSYLYYGDPWYSYVYIGYVYIYIHTHTYIYINIHTQVPQVDPNGKFYGENDEETSKFRKIGTLCSNIWGGGKNSNISRRGGVPPPHT